MLEDTQGYKALCSLSNAIWVRCPETWEMVVMSCVFGKGLHFYGKRIVSLMSVMVNCFCLNKVIDP